MPLKKAGKRLGYERSSIIRINCTRRHIYSLRSFVKTMSGSDPAFPIPFDGEYPKLGLTKREFFAAMAMQGLCANPNTVLNYEEIAMHAVKFADSLEIYLHRLDCGSAELEKKG